jgi:hypothetical protein
MNRINIGPGFTPSPMFSVLAATIGWGGFIIMHQITPRNIRKVRDAFTRNRNRSDEHIHGREVFAGARETGEGKRLEIGGIRGCGQL